jgi:hypothetical protein
MRNSTPQFVFQEDRRRQQALHARLADGSNVQKIFFPVRTLSLVWSSCCVHYGLTDIYDACASKSSKRFNQLIDFRPADDEVA